MGMESVIKALELLGKTTSLKSMPRPELDKVLNPLNLDAAVQQAILAKDTASLEMLLNVRHKIVCMVNTPEPDDIPSDTPEPEDDQPEDKPETVKVVGYR